MMEFADLIAAKDKAIEADDAAERNWDDASKALDAAVTYHAETSAALTAAHQAIHDVLAERGEHYIIDQKTGTLTVFKVSDEPPGYVAVQPIPGTTKASK